MKFYILFFSVRKSRNWDSGVDETQSFNVKYNLWCNSRRSNIWPEILSLSRNIAIIRIIIIKIY